jgi:DNA topoisomerase-1
VLDEMLAPHIYPPRADGGDPRQCPVCGKGTLSLRLGRFGAFLGCSNYPECKNTRPLSANGNGEGAVGNKVLGQDPVTGLDATLRSGRFGPYVQLGEGKDGEKPKRAGLPKGTEAASVTLELALKLLSLPREVGKHPESGSPILAGIGRFGPYVQHEKTYANLETGDDVLNIGLNRAVTLIAEKLLRPSKGRRFGADPGRPLGDHPDKGGPIVVKSGRYGPYVSHGGVNATLPKDQTPESVTLADAVALLDARAAKMGDAPRARRAPGRKKAAPKAAKPAKAPAKAKVARKAKSAK